MSRARSSVPKKQRHKKVLAIAKGHYSVRHRHFRRAKESALHAMAYAYAHRRERKGDFRKLWILRIGAATRNLGLSYSKFIQGLNLAGIGLNRKVLSEMAIKEPEGFAKVVEQARQALPQA